MQVYTDRSTAPLKFHKLLKWFSLPLGVFISIGNVLLCFTDGTALTYFFDTGYYILYAVLTIASLIGMWRWKTYGPYSLCVRQVLDTINYCAAVFADFSLGRSPGKSLTNLITSVIALSIFWTYYKKRMELFSDEAEPVSGKLSDKLKTTLLSIAEVTVNATGILYVLLRFVLPLLPIIWFTTLFRLGWVLSFIFIMVWLIVPGLCAPFWIYALVVALDKPAVFSVGFSIVAFLMGLVYILQQILPFLISLLPDDSSNR